MLGHCLDIPCDMDSHCTRKQTQDAGSTLFVQHLT